VLPPWPLPVPPFFSSQSLGHSFSSPAVLGLSLTSVLCTGGANSLQQKSPMHLSAPVKGAPLCAGPGLEQCTVCKHTHTHIHWVACAMEPMWYQQCMFIPLQMQQTHAYQRHMCMTSLHAMQTHFSMPSSVHLPPASVPFHGDMAPAAISMLYLHSLQFFVHSPGSYRVPNCDNATPSSTLCPSDDIAII